jgi:hypothetical protein
MAVLVAATAPSRSGSNVSYRLVGRGKALPTQIDSGPCPQGRTSIEIASRSGTRIGTAYVCVLTIERTDDSNGNLQRITQVVRETDSLPRGAIVSRQRQIFAFGRDPRRSSASFRGRVVKGTGRYARTTGTVSGGGPTIDGIADWRVIVRLRRADR